MTCHVAFSADGRALILADSQTSTATREYHGAQKLLAGDGWILGGAGMMLLIEELFRELDSLKPDASSLPNAMTEWLDRIVAERARGQVEFVYATEQGLFQLLPGVMTKPVGPARFASIGSGGPFVSHADGRDAQLGTSVTPTTLHDMFVAATDFIEVADQSLTVDDQLLCAVLDDGKSYLFGDKRILPKFADAQLRAAWDKLGLFFGDMLALSSAIRSERTSAMRRVSTAMTGGWVAGDETRIATSMLSLESHRQDLKLLLQAYMTAYAKSIHATP